jgi:transposase, IS30 family
VGRHPKSAEVRGRFWTARASGATMREAAQAAGISRTAGHYWLKESGGVRPRPKAPRPPLRLSLEEREEFSRGLARKESLTSIAARLGRSVSTVSREVRRNATLAGYRAHRADRTAQARTSRPRLGKLATNERLRERIEEGLKQRWSPQQVSARLRLDLPDDPTMQVSRDDLHVAVRAGQGRSAGRAHRPSPHPPGASTRATPGLRRPKTHRGHAASARPAG